MPFWQRRIDVLILVDSNEDEAGALSSLIGRYQIAILMANEGDAGALVQAGINDLAQQGVLRQTVIEGQSIVVDDGVRLTVLVSQSEQTLALLLTYNKFRLLLPGSSEAPNGVLLRPDTLGAVLLIPEMPAPALTDPGFLTALQPQLIIVLTSEADPGLSNLLLTNSYTIPPLGRLEVVTDGEHITTDAR
jgi:beta-lactamase superfamily II metal-dependent hydrolase